VRWRRAGLRGRRWFVRGWLGCGTAGNGGAGQGGAECGGHGVEGGFAGRAGQVSRGSAGGSALPPADIGTAAGPGLRRLVLPGRVIPAGAGPPGVRVPNVPRSVLRVGSLSKQRCSSDRSQRQHCSRRCAESGPLRAYWLHPTCRQRSHPDVARACGARHATPQRLLVVTYDRPKIIKSLEMGAPCACPSLRRRTEPRAAFPLAPKPGAPGFAPGGPGVNPGVRPRVCFEGLEVCPGFWGSAPGMKWNLGRIHICLIFFVARGHR
jgi:hypothetical protein